MTVYDFTTPDIRKNMLETGGLSSFTATSLAKHGIDFFYGRHRVLDAADLVVAGGHGS
jgi:hypothetical protein